MVIDMMYDVEAELNLKDHPDGTKDYPATSCRIIKEFHPEVSDG
jgi:hypothetical protein